MTASDLPPSTPVPGLHGDLARRRWDGAADRPTLVLIPGLDGASDGFAAAAAAVAGRRTVEALDLRGRNHADAAGPWGVAAHADDVVAILDAAPAPVVLAGHSFGAHVAAEVARRRPDLVARLVLLDGGTPRRLAPEADRVAVAASVAATIVSHLASKPYAVAAGAVEADTASMFCDPVANEAVFGVEMEVVMVRAELGVAPGLPPVVPDDAVRDLGASLGDRLDDRVVSGADHFTVIGTPSEALVDALLA